ncbi:hypothetical protein HDC36_003095 [Xanthomonas sp. JAI131]|uniref:hypothetical protein n=1 Tax=Xanthomonas sp. JAI131 TaxID=2723067 RepID=UPI0015CCCC82|nr:hypothetical protein [Xanthomonas sp. JAI131]NYF21626.1 hypothetical protein [Xanthomonas sp. JAI131]
MKESLFLKGATKDLISLERNALQFQSIYLSCAELTLGKEQVDQVRPLIKSASEDLIAGCELARLGFLKQAYTLWRSWFEQAIFALYFLESPISRIAWKVEEEVNFGDKPSHRLMLHQLIAESGEKHQFAAVYNSRFNATMAAFKKSGIPGDQKILKRTERIFTTLSQGVHGTFRPKLPSGPEECAKALGQHGHRALKEAANVIGVYWVCFLTESLSLDESMLTDLRSGSLDPANPKYTAVEDIGLIAELNLPFFSIIGV